ncbi:MAG TPA: orotate phosphoribosyltransferase [Rickettsiales bacterium]|nr:orotate phosphoribosyltransferase [Rickettsiales bacterium]
MQLSKDEILQEFVDAKAILKGHFILSSGLHSDSYIQCALALANPVRAAKLCQELASKIISDLGTNFADIIVSPAMGGVVVGYELARQVGLNAIFCERVNGNFQLRRGFELRENARVLVVEDVITTGKSSLETFDLVQKLGAKIVAEACLIDRSGENIEDILKVPTISLLKLDIKTFDKNNIPSELQNIEAVKPGSRFLKK